MIAKFRTKVLVILGVVSIFNISYSQVTIEEDTLQSEIKSTKFIEFYNLRGTNLLDLGIGSSIINGDFENPLFEIYFKAGYKRYITPHFNLGISYHKFNLAYEDLFNNGFMTFDFNIEYLILPHKRVSPYIFAGGGYVASNYFEETSSKAQAGAGLEYVFIENMAVTLFADYNYMFNDTLDGLEAGSSDDTFFRMGIGLQFYFGGAKKKERLYGNLKTVINSNLLTPSNSTKVTK